MIEYYTVWEKGPAHLPTCHIGRTIGSFLASAMILPTPKTKISINTNTYVHVITFSELYVV